jgi:hypothetical protein
MDHTADANDLSLDPSRAAVGVAVNQITRSGITCLLRAHWYACAAAIV